MVKAEEPPPCRPPHPHAIGAYVNFRQKGELKNVYINEHFMPTFESVRKLISPLPLISKKEPNAHGRNIRQEDTLLGKPPFKRLENKLENSSMCKEKYNATAKTNSDRAKRLEFHVFRVK